MKIYDFNGKKNISGDRIREARLKRRLSQSDLAAQMQVEGIMIERDSVSRIEIGTRFIPDYELPFFAKVLGVSVDWLLGLSG
ncbi:MAG: helix-turn-helix transcriptional regulator [Lawsonibacter sp.]|uniref:helix-turn-helix domain-containing protein n=1 Tax=Lawsonibacter sp. JLR.KK007 TaxID=3114293 RepID=UPI0021714960|nr:helix-turn-helix transcriptional regulator [Lawsonibacter sp.]